MTVTEGRGYVNVLVNYGFVLNLYCARPEAC